MAHLKPVLAGVFVVVSLGLAAETTAGKSIRIDGSSGVRPLAKALGGAFARLPGGMAVEIGKGLGT